MGVGRDGIRRKRRTVRWMLPDLSNNVLRTIPRPSHTFHLLLTKLNLLPLAPRRAEDSEPLGRKLMGKGKGCNEFGACKDKCQAEYQPSQCVAGCVAGEEPACGTPSGHEDDTRKLLGDPVATPGARTLTSASLDARPNPLRSVQSASPTASRSRRRSASPLLHVRFHHASLRLWVPGLTLLLVAPAARAL